MPDVDVIVVLVITGLVALWMKTAVPELELTLVLVIVGSGQPGPSVMMRIPLPEADVAVVLEIVKKALPTRRHGANAQE